MPEYEYICLREECKHEWCEVHSIVKNASTTCPQCKQETAKRLISGGSGRGIVNLTGQDLVNKVKSDAAALENYATKSESFASNFLGDNLYQKRQVEMDNAKKSGGSFRRKGW
jgi:putative FmdB family regulatory protein